MKMLGIKDGEYENCILHFNGRKKPWKVYSGVVDEEYWKYFKKTPWGFDNGLYDGFYASAKNGRVGIIDWIMNTSVNTYVRTIHSIATYLIRRFL